jgi:hypothetical protein
VLEGQIEIIELNRDQTHLALNATCQPPFGPAGRLVAEALLQRLAEATVRDFVERMRDRLESPEVLVRKIPVQLVEASP